MGATSVGMSTMRKLMVTCGTCGRRMQAPRSAIGRSGLCPFCGATVPITADSASPEPPAPKRGLFGSGSWWRGQGQQPTEDAKRKFGEAVDLYYSGKYAESMAIFTDLAKVYPDNPDIQNGHAQCMRALRRPPARRHLALEDKGARLENAVLDEDTVKRVVLEKLLAGDTESTQLQAAELACRILGMFENGKHPALGKNPAPRQPHEPPTSYFDWSAGLSSEDAARDTENPRTHSKDPVEDANPSGRGGQED